MLDSAESAALQLREVTILKYCSHWWSKREDLGGTEPAKYAQCPHPPTPQVPDN